jgi:hypothetical protein
VTARFVPAAVVRAFTCAGVVARCFGVMTVTAAAVSAAVSVTVAAVRMCTGLAGT